METVAVGPNQSDHTHRKQWMSDTDSHDVYLPSTLSPCTWAVSTLSKVDIVRLVTTSKSEN